MFLIAIASQADALPSWLRRAFLALSSALLGLGLCSLPLQFLFEDARLDAALNALEWSYALLMVAAYPLTAIAWRRTGFRLRFTLG